MMIVVKQSQKHKMWTEITRRKYEREGPRYASDLTDAEWALIEPHMPPAGNAPLDAKQLGDVAKWIDLGAAYDKPLLDRASVAKKPLVVTAEDRSLELSPEALTRLIEAAARRAVAHLASLPEQPSADVAGGAELARSLAAPR